MEASIWRQLRDLESTDLVRKRFKQIHDRTLSAFGANSICSSTKQARAFFENAVTADISVRPLLTFYGIASLARAATLLLDRSGCETNLARGHGLTTMNWPVTLSGPLEPSLRKIGDLRISTVNGFLRDFREKINSICDPPMLSHRSGITFCYSVPSINHEFTFFDLLARLPDLDQELKASDITALYIKVGNYTPGQVDTFLMFSGGAVYKGFREQYLSQGCSIEKTSIGEALASLINKDRRSLPQFTFALLENSPIDQLYLIEPFDNFIRYPPIIFAYIVSYVMGMLTRYFPTHWNALTRGGSGDRYWPLLHRAHDYVELAFPRLITQLLELTSRGGEAIQSLHAR